MKKLLISIFIFGLMIMPAFAKDKKIRDVVSNNEEIVLTKTFPISAVDPQKKSLQNKDLVIYTKLFGSTTNTDLKGLEAVVVNNRVEKINQNNTFIPENGYVISGHGEAKKFISDYLFEGANVEIDFDQSLLVVKTHKNNYIDEARFRLEKGKELLSEADKDVVDTEQMEFYIDRAEGLLNTTKKLVAFEDFESAKKLAQDSMVYSDMALYFSLPYKENEFKGIKVFPYQKTEEEVRQAFNAINNLAIDNIFIEGYYNGQTVYKSNVQKSYNLPEQNRYYGEFDPLKAWIDIAKDYGKNIYVTINAFELGNIPKSTIKTSIAAVYPDWLYKTGRKVSLKGNLYLDSSNADVQRYLLSLAEEISTKYDIAGINIAGLKTPSQNKQDVKEFVNKLTAYQRKNGKIKLAIDIHPDNTDIIGWNMDENTILCPILTSSDLSFTQKFLDEIKKNSYSANIFPIYMTPYLEEKPRNFFDQVTFARNQGINGIILYNFDYLTKEYTNALKISIFNAPADENSEKNSGGILVNFNEDKEEK